MTNRPRAKRLGRNRRKRLNRRGALERSPPNSSATIGQLLGATAFSVTAVYAAIAMIERAMEKIVATEGNDMNLPKKRPSPEKRDGIRLIDRGKAMPHKSSNRATSRRISSTGSGAEDSLAQR